MYCCDGDSSGDCCKDTSATFVISAVVTSVTRVSETKTRSYSTSSSSTTPSSSTTAKSATTSVSTNTSTAIQSTHSSNSGVKIGVGVGVGVAALITIALGLVWFLRRRRIQDNPQSLHSGPNLPHEVEAPKPVESPSELAHDQTTEIPAELPQGQNHPVEMDASTEINHLDGSSNGQPFSDTGADYPHGVPIQPATSLDFQRTVRPAFSTSSIVHPGLLDAAATASRFLDRPSTAPTPAPTPEPSEQQMRSSSHDELSAPISPDENPLLPFPPKSSSKSRLPPPLSANQPSASVADRLNPSKSWRPFKSAPQTPIRSFHQYFPATSKQPSIQVVPPTPRQLLKDLPTLPSSEPPVIENRPNTVKAMLRNHPQPLQSNRPLSFAASPSRDSVVHEPYPDDFPLRGSSMGDSSSNHPNAANGANQGFDPTGVVANDSNSTDFALFQSSTRESNVPHPSAPDSAAIQNYSHKLTMQQSQQFRNGTSSADVEDIPMF